MPEKQNIHVVVLGAGSGGLRILCKIFAAERAHHAGGRTNHHLSTLALPGRQPRPPRRNRAASAGDFSDRPESPLLLDKVWIRPRKQEVLLEEKARLY